MAVAPVGRFVAGEGFAHFCLRPSLWGVILWARPDAEALAELVSSLAVELGAPAVPHRSIVDASRLEGVDGGAFSALSSYVEEQAGALREQVTHLSLVRPAGLTGAMVAGFFEVLPRPYPVKVFEDAAGALEWLGEPPSDAATLAGIHGEASGTPAAVVRLRALVERDLHGASIQHCARALGMSERTLQRRLREAGTSFQEQLGAARLRAAQRLLLDGDEPLTNIALEVGCASLQHFSAMFRKRLGESPSRWRARHKK